MYNSEMAGNIGFFLFPPLEAGAPVAAMSAPLTYGIAANAEHADCAAFFFNWVATNEQRARSTSTWAARTRAARPIWRSHPSRRDR